MAWRSARRIATLDQSGTVTFRETTTICIERLVEGDFDDGGSGSGPT
jgi:hypothetical protein